jgi:hypothetical protein
MNSAEAADPAATHRPDVTPAKTSAESADVTPAETSGMASATPGLCPGYREAPGKCRGG